MKGKKFYQWKLIIVLYLGLMIIYFGGYLFMPNPVWFLTPYRALSATIISIVMLRLYENYNRDMRPYKDYIETFGAMGMFLILIVGFTLLASFLANLHGGFLERWFVISITTTALTLFMISLANITKK